MGTVKSTLLHCEDVLGPLTTTPLLLFPAVSSREKKKKENIMPFGVNLMNILHRDAQA